MGTLHEMRLAHTFSKLFAGVLIAVGQLQLSTHWSVSTYTFKRARSCSSRRSVASTTLSSASPERSFLNEEVLGEAVAPFRQQVVIATKFGFDIDSKPGQPRAGVNSCPAHIRTVVGENAEAAQGRQH